MGDLIKRKNAKYRSFKDKDHALIFFPWKKLSKLSRRLNVQVFITTISHIPKKVNKTQRKVRKINETLVLKLLKKQRYVLLSLTPSIPILAQ